MVYILKLVVFALAFPLVMAIDTLVVAATYAWSMVVREYDAAVLSAALWILIASTLYNWKNVCSFPLFRSVSGF